jgi:hypothetical protein
VQYQYEKPGVNLGLLLQSILNSIALPALAVENFFFSKSILIHFHAANSSKSSTSGSMARSSSRWEQIPGQQDKKSLLGKKDRAGAQEDVHRRQCHRNK